MALSLASTGMAQAATPGSLTICNHHDSFVTVSFPDRGGLRITPEMGGDPCTTAQIGGNSNEQIDVFAGDRYLGFDHLQRPAGHRSARDRGAELLHGLTTVTRGRPKRSGGPSSFARPVVITSVTVAWPRAAPAANRRHEDRPAHTVR
ncbi:hypothetical protein AB0I53_40150 [Saccharopolyspora sp. NPDC050389]|uniref:hypothetical protein n=1 Tax=Saccharopolyspora sp. NPDC050389 TaxID=3155516 RepID=UPI0033D42226